MKLIIAIKAGKVTQDIIIPVGNGSQTFKWLGRLSNCAFPILSMIFFIFAYIFLNRCISPQQTPQHTDSFTMALATVAPYLTDQTDMQCLQGHSSYQRMSTPKTRHFYTQMTRSMCTCRTAKESMLIFTTR